MSTSQTYDFVDTQQIDFITEAFERNGKLPSTLTSHDLDSARRSLNYLFSDWANDGPNLWAVDLDSVAMVDGQASYTLDEETAYILQAYTRTTSGGVNTDLMLTPISRAEYAAIPNKAQEGARPTQFYFQRTAVPSLFVWPVPQDATVTVYFYRMKVQQDAGAFTNTLDGNNRWMEAIASGLACKLATKYAPDRLAFLEAQYQQAYARAKAEDRERVPLRITIDGWGGF